MLIKICGIRDAETAAFAAKEGADFIGMILTPGFRRSVPLELAKKIAEAARENGAAPVGVFVSEHASKIASACQFIGIEVVQAYGLSEPLPQQLKRIFINEPKAELRPDFDLLLMETEKPGTGAKLDFESFIPPQVQPWLLAGGLTPENVKTAILRFRPSGVDVSSGVEKEGIKSQELIFKLIHEVRNYE
jgi:phosphoribosylanthranilate isomerase